MTSTLLVLACSSESLTSQLGPKLSLADGVTRDDSIALGATAPRTTTTAILSEICIIKHQLPGSISGCSDPVPSVVPASPWLQHSGGIFEPAQTAPISIGFPGMAHAITMESSGALKCSGSSLGRMIGYRDGVEVVNVENALIDPSDCGADDVTFGVRGLIPADLHVDSLVLVGPDPWTFDVSGQQGRARLDYTITYDPSTGLKCTTVTRGEMTTCQLQFPVDSVTGWRFAGPPLPGLFDSVRVESTSTALAWTGVAVQSGIVSAIVSISGTPDTVTATLTVNGRTGSAWRWDHGVKWAFTSDVAPLCNYVPFVVPGNTRLGINRRRSSCIEDTVPEQRVSIEPSVQVPAAQDSGFTADSVTGGPNAGFWYVTAVHYRMDRASEINPFIRAGAAGDTLTHTQDIQVCRQNLNPTPPAGAPVVVNFFTYNQTCRLFSLTALFDAILAHEYLGTNNPLDPNLANGHEARRLIAAREPINDPYRIVEPIIAPTYASLRFELIHRVNEADRRISEAADPDHVFVRNNYLVQGNCGEAWVFDVAQGRYRQIRMRFQLPTGGWRCL